MDAGTSVRRMRTGGYYADPSSPIASTPQRRRPVGFVPSRLPKQPLSPMKQPSIVPQRRESLGGKVEEDDDEWRGRIFSPVFQPVLKTVGVDGAEKPSPPRVNGVTAASPGSPHSSLARSDGTGSSGSTVPPCSLASPSLYGGAPSARQPSPITTPKPTIAAGEDEPAGGVQYAITQTSTYRSTVNASGHRVTNRSTTTTAVVAQEDGGMTLVAASDNWGDEITDDMALDAGGLDEGNEEDMDDLDYDDFNPYLFIKMLPRYEDVAPRRRRIVLPKKLRGAPKISLVLDLDETLVHCSIEPIPDADLTFSVCFNGQDYQVYVRKRPYLAHFLEEVSKMFEVTVFTASQSVYAETLLNLIDPKRKLVKYRLFREACLNVDGNYLKDLTVLGRDLRHTVLVDNSPHAFGYQVDNGIPIESWFDDPTDTELLKLIQFLKTIQSAKDVRPHVRRKFRLWDLINAA